MAEISDYEADKKARPRSCAQIVTDRGTRIYLLPVETFPGHINNLYLIDHPEHALLFDVGTTLCNHEIDARFSELRDRFGVHTGPEDLSSVLISHAHIDHFGNARRFRDAGVPIAIHELDARVLAGFDERLLLASRDFGLFLRQTGLSDEAVRRFIALYRYEKKLFSDLVPDRRLRNGETVGPGWPVLHVPGHCPGMVCLVVDDVVLTADHVLSRITPAQRPQSITPFMGLETYLRSLGKLRELGPFDLGLGAHEAPIPDVGARIVETVAHHGERLRETYRLCANEPRTIKEVSRELFGDTSGFGVLLALSEAGAHVEYLHELGYLAIDNIDAVADRVDAAPRYRPTERPLAGDPLG